MKNYVLYAATVHLSNSFQEFFILEILLLRQIANIHSSYLDTVLQFLSDDPDEMF